MSSAKSFTVILLLTTIMMAMLYTGRSFFKPIYQRIKGHETIDSVIEKIEIAGITRLQPNFKAVGIDGLPSEIKLLAFKNERLLEVYVNKEREWKLLKSYPFTAYSGELGPKLREGDRQIPEGIYEIESLNPNSSYHLSLKLNYPNAFDISKSPSIDIEELGSDIFIHGNQVSIGCIAIGDKSIEELFLLANHAIKNKIEVIISPTDFRHQSHQPNIPSISWENELYAQITAKLSSINTVTQ